MSFLFLKIYDFFFKRKYLLFTILFLIVALLCFMAIRNFDKKTTALYILLLSFITGIFINYFIHFFSHFRHIKSVRQLIKDIAVPLTIGSITTIAGLLGLLLFKSVAVNYFVLFSALCIMGSALFTMIFLPFFVKKESLGKTETHKNNFIDKITSYHFERNPYVIAGVVILTIFFFVMALKISFENHNILPDVKDFIDNGLKTTLLISSLFVFLALMFSYGRLELAFIAFFPLLLSWIWISGFMNLLGIKFNISGISVFVFILFLGIDYNVFIMDGLLQQYKKGAKLISSYKTAVFLSAITFFIGFGFLIFFKNPDIKSIALIFMTGMFSFVIISFTITPALFNLLVYKKNKFRKFPLTAYSLIYGVVCYSYFLAGCIITGFLGLTFYKILPVSKKKRQFLYHSTLKLVCKSTMYLMYFTKKKLINFTADTFKKPALIIVNHQSIIDIPLLLMFSPKVIMVTNDAFYYSKLIGIIVKLGGFLPASAGYDFIGKKLSVAVEDGYSILVFPEGTRANDGQIHRFHKGAFYLAEKMKLDILPMVCNGTGNYIAKGELMGKKSLITVKFLERIKHDDLSWGENYTERAKNIQKYFRKEYLQLLAENYNKPEQLNDIVVKNFIYKGPILEWYTRIKLRLESNYRIYDELIPKNAKILDIGCGYGYMALMLGLISKDRTIRAVDYDEDKIEVASHCMSKPANVSYAYENIMNAGFGNYDVFILSDILHYLDDAQQYQLLLQCAQHLNDGGFILIRDGNKDLTKRHGMTRLSEFFSKNIGFNKTNNLQFHFFSETKLQEIIGSFGLKMRIINKGKLTSNMLFLLER